MSQNGQIGQTKLWLKMGEAGRPYELHHIGQNPESPLAELTYDQHHCNGNFTKLHTFDESSIDRQQFNKERKEYWETRSQTL